MEKKIPSNVNVVVRGQVKSENSSLPVGVRVSETRVLNLPIKALGVWEYLREHPTRFIENQIEMSNQFVQLSETYIQYNPIHLLRKSMLFSR